MNPCYSIVIGLTKNMTERRNSVIPFWSLKQMANKKNYKTSQGAATPERLFFLKIPTGTIEVRKAMPW